MRLREPIESKDGVGGPTDLQEVEDEIWKANVQHCRRSNFFVESERLVELVLENIELLKGADKKANVAARREEKWQEIADSLHSETAKLANWINMNSEGSSCMKKKLEK